MKCPFCGYTESKVLDTRPADDGERIRRRRECLKCEKRFTTYEAIETMPLMVIKKNGDREAYSREKMVRGMLKACEKRPIPITRLDEIADEIETTLQNRMEREIPSTDIGQLCMEHLKELDQVAYVRFASVYREFQDVSSFLTELEGILKHD